MLTKPRGTCVHAVGSEYPGAHWGTEKRVSTDHPRGNSANTRRKFQVQLLLLVLKGIFRHPECPDPKGLAFRLRCHLAHNGSEPIPLQDEYVHTCTHTDNTVMIQQSPPRVSAIGKTSEHWLNVAPRVVLPTWFNDVQGEEGGWQRSPRSQRKSQ